MSVTNDIWVFGDSHWRVYFDSLNHGGPRTCEVDGVRFHDTTGNGLSGATIYGLLNEDSRHGARRHILKTLAEVGRDCSVGLVFGEVDCRYHSHLWRRMGGIDEVAMRYRRFVDEVLERIDGYVFVYFGFAYAEYFVQGKDEAAISDWDRALLALEPLLRSWMGGQERIVFIGANEQVRGGSGYLLPRYQVPDSYAQSEEVHLNCPNTFRDLILPVVQSTFEWHDERIAFQKFCGVLAPKCKKCGSEYATPGNCPYDSDINDTETPCYCCDACRTECSDEI